MPGACQESPGLRGGAVGGRRGALSVVLTGRLQVTRGLLQIAHWGAEEAPCFTSGPDPLLWQLWGCRNIVWRTLTWRCPSFSPDEFPFCGGRYIPSWKGCPDEALSCVSQMPKAVWLLHSGCLTLLQVPFGNWASSSPPPFCSTPGSFLLSPSQSEVTFPLLYFLSPHPGLFLSFPL